MAKRFAETVQRKLYKYEIYCEKRGEKAPVPFPYMDALMAELLANYKHLDLDYGFENRWYAVEDVKQNSLRYEIVLINCKYNYRPNLINVKDRRERSSPKTVDEGDKEKTHVLISGNSFLYESRRNGTGIKIFSAFLNTAWSNIRKAVDPSIGTIVIKQVLDNNFLDIIKRANRVKNIKIVAHSRLINSEYFNFSNDEGVDDCYTLEIKAKRRKKFDKESLIRNFERLFANDVKPEKVLVELNDEEGNSRIVNTDRFAQQFIVWVGKNDNGEIDSADFFEQMKDIQ